MSKADEFMHNTLVQQKTANDAMFNGDPQPYMAMWSHTDDVSLFGAWGPCKVGWPAVSKTFEWVGSRFSNGDMEFDVQVAQAGELIAYSVGYERGKVVLDGGQKRPMTIRVTHAYRWEDSRWRIVHRHGDFAPVDESPPG